jgi:hypothetical protein
MSINVDDWKIWAYSSKIDSRIIAYISYKKENLFNFDATTYQKSFATPRSWEFVDSILKSEIKESLMLNAISGAVGKDIAISFLSFAKVMYQLPDIQQILETGTAEYPDSIDVLYALCSGLVSHLMYDFSDERLEALLSYALDLESEFSVMLVQDLQRLGITMQQSKIFDKWVSKFSYLL